MAKQSLFAACKRLFRDQLSGTYEVGNNNIFLELYTQQDITDGATIGDSSEENIVVVAGDTITIPEGYTLTPVKPKKSLVVICNTFVNNGTVSMYQKAPNVLPHDLFIIEKNELGGNKDVLIPAYANNSITVALPGAPDNVYGTNGTNGTDRNCGSGGTGTGWSRVDYNVNTFTSGSGYAFGGGAGTSGYGGERSNFSPGSANSTYPMRAGNASEAALSYNSIIMGGVGNPQGVTNYNISGGARRITDYQNFGCGGRIIIFCKSFNNNGNISVNGTATKKALSDGYDIYNVGWGGASGAGAVDLFYTALIKQGTITANGGENFVYLCNGNRSQTPGKGGDGSITLTPWLKSSVLKPIAKYMSKENMVYFLTNYIQRLKQGED